MASRTLAAQEWRAHPLDRVGGSVGVIVSVIVSVVVGSPASLAADARSLASALSVTVADMAVMVALLGAIWTRSRWTPERNLARTVLAMLVAVLDLLVWFPDPQVPAALRGAVLAVFGMLGTAVAVSLVVGARPNVMVGRRERAV